MIQSIEDVIEPQLRTAGFLRPTELVRVFQYAYSTSVSASSDTHAGGGALDHRKGSDAETKLWRQCGVADWQRGSPEDPFFSDHNHGIWQGCPHLSDGAKRQVAEYRNGQDGLAGDGTDDSPRVAPITWQAAYDRYVKQQGVPLMADAVPIKIDFDDDQLLIKDVTGAPAQHVWINDKNGASIVVGASSGVDIRATIAVSGLKEGERVQLFFHKVWRKAGETDINKGGDDPVYITHIPGVSSPSVHFTFAGSLGKADTGWTPAIRITAKTTSETAVITRRQIRGWKLAE